MKALKVAALGFAAVVLAACGNSSVSCNNADAKSCTAGTWAGVMSPAPACTNGATEISACAGSATNTCTWTDSKTYPSPVNFVTSFYAGADLNAAQTFCTSVSGTYK